MNQNELLQKAEQGDENAQRELRKLAISYVDRGDCDTCVDLLYEMSEKIAKSGESLTHTAQSAVRDLMVVYEMPEYHNADKNTFIKRIKELSENNFIVSMLEWGCILLGDDPRNVYVQKFGALPRTSDIVEGLRLIDNAITMAENSGTENPLDFSNYSHAAQAYQYVKNLVDSSQVKEVYRKNMECAEKAVKLADGMPPDYVFVLKKIAESAKAAYGAL